MKKFVKAANLNKKHWVKEIEILQEEVTYLNEELEYLREITQANERI